MCVCGVCVCVYVNNIIIMYVCVYACVCVYMYVNNNIIIVCVYIITYVCDVCVWCVC